MTTKTVTLLDGGMGKTLEANGAPFRQPEWSALALMESPTHVSEAHAQFVAAGADIITTNNYAVVPFHIGTEKFEADGEALTLSSALLAREAAGPSTRVAGSLPPLYGSYEPELFNAETAPAHLGLIADTLAPHIDLFLCETQSSTEEASVSLAAASVHGLPMWVSYTLDDASPDVPLLRSGEPIEAAISVAKEAGAEAILFNCSQPEVLSSAVSLAVSLAGELSVGIYANAFVPKPEKYAANEVVLGHRDDLDPAGYLAFVSQWVEAGASIVGGCCGIMPDHIAAMSEYLSN